MDLPTAITQLSPAVESRLVTVRAESALGIERRLQAAFDAVPPGQGWALVGLHAAGTGAGGAFLVAATIGKPPAAQVFGSIPLLQRNAKDADDATYAAGDPGGSIVVAGLSVFLQGGETLMVRGTAAAVDVDENLDTLFLRLYVDGVAVASKSVNLGNQNAAFEAVSFQYEAIGLAAGNHDLEVRVDWTTAVDGNIAVTNAAIDYEAFGTPTLQVATPLPGARVWAVEGEASADEAAPQPAGTPPNALRSLGNLLEARIASTLFPGDTANVNQRVAGASSGHRLLAVAVGPVVGVA